MFKSRCDLCGIKISKNQEIIKEVKVPEFSKLKGRPFCCEEHANAFKYQILTTKRTSYCPSCGV